MTKKSVLILMLAIILSACGFEVGEGTPTKLHEVAVTETSLPRSTNTIPPPSPTTTPTVTPSPTDTPIETLVPTPSGPTPLPDWAYEQYGPPWIPNCNNEDMYDGVALPAWANGFCVPGRITWESQFYSMPGDFYGLMAYYGEGRMEQQVIAKGYDPAEVAGVSLPNCAAIHETVWIKYTGSGGWRGPFKVVDCSGRNHLYYHMVGMGLVVEIGYVQASEWGVFGRGRVDVHVGGGRPGGAWNGVYLPYWWLENILEWELSPEGD